MTARGLCPTSNLDEYLLGTGISISDSDGDEFKAGRKPLINEPVIITIINSILLND